MVTDVNQIHCGNRFVTHTHIKSSWYTPEANTLLQVNYVSIKRGRKPQGKAFPSFQSLQPVANNLYMQEDGQIYDSHKEIHDLLVYTITYD